MRTPQKIFVALAAVSLAAVALAGCSIDTAPVASASEKPAPAAESTGPAVDRPVGSGRAGNVNPQIGPIGDHQSVVDALCGKNPAGTDTGSRFGASGTVEAVDADGLATIYSVARGDSYKAIVERFCLDGKDFSILNAITNIGQVYDGDVYAFTESAQVDARRAAGYGYPACPRDQWGYPDLASISWMTLSDDRTKAEGIGTPIDTGAAGTAVGTVRADADGKLIDYTVAPGDTWIGIMDRFCIDPHYVFSLTGAWGENPMLHPGDVLPLQPVHLEIVTGF